MKSLNCLVFSVFTLTRMVSAEATTPPFKVRANSELIQKAFHFRDQEVLRVFQGLSLPLLEGQGISGLSFSLQPQTGDLADFDFDLSISNEDVGASSSNVAFTGKGEMGDSDFTFSGPIDSIKMQYALGSKFNHEHSYDSLVFQEKSFVLTIDAEKIAVEGAELTAENKQALADSLSKKLIEMKVNIQDAEQSLID